MILVIKRLEKLAVTSSSYVDCGAVQHCVVERVHRLTVFKHYVVGNVNDVVDGTNTCGAKSHSEPEGRGSDLNVLNYLCRIAEAEVAVADLNRKIVVDLITVAKLLYSGSGDVEGLIEADSSLTSETDNRETVGTVRGDLKLNNSVVQHESFLYIHTDLVLILLGENEDSVLDRVGHIVESKIKLGDRAEHTVGGNASEFACLNGDVTGKVCYGNSRGNDVACMYVLRAGNDLSNLAADVNLADPEVVGVGVTLHGNDLSYLYVLDVLAENLVAFNLRTGVGHSVAVFFSGNTVCICKIVKPFK